MNSSVTVFFVPIVLSKKITFNVRVRYMLDVVWKSVINGSVLITKRKVKNDVRVTSAMKWKMCVMSVIMTNGVLIVDHISRFLYPCTMSCTMNELTLK